MKDGHIPTQLRRLPHTERCLLHLLPLSVPTQAPRHQLARVQVVILPPHSRYPRLTPVTHLTSQAATVTCQGRSKNLKCNLTLKPLHHRPQRRANRRCDSESPGEAFVADGLSHHIGVTGSVVTPRLSHNYRHKTPRNTGSERDSTHDRKGGISVSRVARHAVQR